ncbi:hypothetical protein [Pseudonocardia sp. D17]|uniref:hypothetical protein n=1 Tax=Pseudonocardia sp. D17 TaxID=882661 RepID=UPI002B365C12|nr:hypothetical protein PSD17_13620 [Pseudonocardia sp. D17]
MLGRYRIETCGRSRQLVLSCRTARHNLVSACGVIGDEPVVGFTGRLGVAAEYQPNWSVPTCVIVPTVGASS